MTHELESLERRIATLEDDELEVMERVEESQRSVDSLTAQVAAADERLGRWPPRGRGVRHDRRPAARRRDRACSGGGRGAGGPAGAL
ncbi:MAG: hypothetical protein R2731_17955 [Nocardioides sp.]